MSKTILANLDGFTPVIDCLVKEYGLVTAAVFGRIWRFCQMKDGVCQASLETLAEDIGLDKATIMRHAKKLVDFEYLIDLTPDLRNHPHTYADTGKVTLTSKIGVAHRNAGVAQDNTGVAENQLKIVIKKDSKIDTRPSKEELLKNAGMDWQLKAGLSSEEIAKHLAREQTEKDRAILYEKCMGYGSLPFWTDKGLGRLLKFLLTKTPEEIKTFAEWSKRPYAGLNPVKARQYPNLVIECWDQAFGREEDEPKRPSILDEDESEWVPAPPRK
jgi:hypothetical protein